MKKFFAVTALILTLAVGIQVATAYQPGEGDIAQIWTYRCDLCGATATKARIVSMRYGLLEDPEPGNYGCSARATHGWRYVVYVAYRYQNGQWVETNRTTY